MAKRHSFMDRICMVSSAINRRLVAGPAMRCNFYCRSLRVFTEGITVNILNQNKINYLTICNTCNRKKGSFPALFTPPFPPPRTFRVYGKISWLH